MGRIRKARGITVPVLLDLKLVDLENCSSGWSLSLDQMSEFVEFIINHRGPISDASKHSWSCRLKSAPSNLEGFINLILSVSKRGFKYPFDYFEKDHLETGIFPCLPRVVDGEFNLDDGRHRVAVLKALEVSKFPMYLIKMERVRRKEHVPDKWNVFFNSAFDRAKIFAYSKEWYEYRRSECYKKCAAVPVIGEISDVFSRTIPVEKPPKKRFFRRYKRDRV